jgi:hypothetical protein
MTGAKRIVAVGASSALGVLALCGTDVIPLPHHDWTQPALGVLRCRTCEELAA